MTPYANVSYHKIVYDSLERNKSYIEIEQIKYKKWNVIEIFKYNGNI